MITVKVEVVGSFYATPGMLIAGDTLSAPEWVASGTVVEMPADAARALDASGQGLICAEHWPSCCAGGDHDH